MAVPSLLVVDDDRGNCAILAKRLTARGYTVDVAYDGISALELVQRNTYRLALLDYQMPGMNGVQLYQRITEIRPAVIGIFLTGYATIETIFPAMGVGVERVLSKPVDFNELFPLVESLVGKPSPEPHKT